MKDMKELYEKFEIIMKLYINIEDFYCIDIHTTSGINFQGEFSEAKILKYTNLGFEFLKESNMKMIARKDYVKIILT